MEGYTIDVRGIRTRAQLHAKIASVLPLPDYYGNNLDALFDVMTEWSDERYIIFLVNDEVEEALGKYYAALRAMCGAACRENPDLTIVFKEVESHEA